VFAYGAGDRGSIPKEVFFQHYVYNGFGGWTFSFLFDYLCLFSFFFYLHLRTRAVQLVSQREGLKNTPIQWTQNNSELQLRHWKRGREDGKGGGEQDGKESV
jgi:hypothetical protein